MLRTDYTPRTTLGTGGLRSKVYGLKIVRPLKTHWVILGWYEVCFLSFFREGRGSRKSQYIYLKKTERIKYGLSEFK